MFKIFFLLKDMDLKRITQGVLLSFVFLFFFGFFIYGAERVLSSGFNDIVFLSSVYDGVGKNNIQDTKPVQRALSPLELDANTKSAISVESNLSGENKIIFKKNKDLKLPIASLTKLMTAVISLENYDLSKNITVSKEADLQLPMLVDLKFGDTLPAESFLYIMLIESSNKAAYALSEQMGEQKFISLMNQKASELGLASTFFADPTGVNSKNVSTANDLVKLTEYILKNHPNIAEISKTKEFDVPNYGKITNTNQLLGEIPEIVCSKTGFTAEAKGCLLLVLNKPENNNYSINIILGADDRFAEMKKMVDWQSAICTSDN
jgi:D-alanyl-D-alanine carboxypeptidase